MDETVLFKTVIGLKWIIWRSEKIVFGAIGPDREEMRPRSLSLRTPLWMKNDRHAAWEHEFSKKDERHTAWERSGRTQNERHAAWERSGKTENERHAA